jgi:DNA-binding transcriptional LysR family regulator
MIDVKLLTLLKVYETGNYTRAAEQLALTQPAVSQHIKQIEKELNTTLFMRSGGKIRPTPEGELVIQYAERVVSLYDNLQQALIDQKHSVSRLRVGVTHTSESNIVTEVLARYAEQNGKISITIQTDTISNLYAMLKTYKIDIAIVEGQVTDPSINSIMLDTDFLVCAVSNEHPLAKKNIITLDELKQERLILRLPDSGTRNLFRAHLASRNISIDEFNVTLEVDNIATIKDLIRRNYGVSILPRSACMDELKKGKMTVLPIENLSMIRELNILYHHSFRHSEILQDIVKIYSEAAKNIGSIDEKPHAYTADQ